MVDLVLVAMVTVIPLGLIASATYKRLTRKARPELKLVEPVPEVEVAEKAVKEVVAKARRINKNKSRKGKRRAKKN